MCGLGLGQGEALALGAVSALPGQRVVAVYFVASPLNYLAARRIAQDHEAGARQVLVHYRSMTAELIQADEWDAVLPIFWPRLDPLPEWVRGTSSAAAMADSFAQFKEVRAPRRATARARERPCRVGLRWIVVRAQVLAKRNMVLKQAAILEQSAQWLAAEV